jgi:serine/threonine protein phosphatase PrpC
MAVRLQLKLGIVAEHDRLSDSPDTLVVVEPSVGSVARSKGHLYLLVTSRLMTRHALEATRLAAETIRNEYYYDESAGIRVCLQKAISTANKRLAHQGDRLGLKTADGSGPIGIGVAVVRGNEMYVATVGPAEAYLIRQARLSTLPDPHRERGLPSADLEPDVWRGEVSVGDSLVLVSPNIIAKLGADELKDAMLTLHPQSAMEHLHHRFVAADGSGSDGAIAFEATEVSSTSRGRTLVPVRPSAPLAGAPDRSPIPLADNVQAAGVAVSAAAGNARIAAGGALERAVAWAQGLMPQRKPAYRRITPLASRRETQRRAALAVLALVAVIGGLGVGVYAFGSSGTPEAAISSVNAGQAAIDAAREDLAKVTGPGIDLVADDPVQALALLTDAYHQVAAAEAAHVAASVVGPLRQKAVAGLDRLYGVVPVRSEDLFTFVPAEGADPIDLRAMVRGPDGAPYVIDRSTRSVYRVDLSAHKATLVARVGMKQGGATFSNARYLGVGGPDLLILDAKNVLWRWRPADAEGKGTLTRIKVQGSSSWGDDIKGFNTFLRDATRGLYNLYVIDPSEQQIRAYSPAADGSGFPAAPTAWLATARDVSGMSSTYVDGDLFAVDGGAIVRFVSGKDDGWDPEVPLDTLLRQPPTYSLVSGATERRSGNVYAFDRPNARIIALDKTDASYKAQYRLAGGLKDWSDLRAMYIVAGIEEAPATVVWLSKDGVHQAVLEAVADVAPKASPSASPGEASPSASTAP